MNIKHLTAAGAAAAATGIVAWWIHDTIRTVLGASQYVPEGQGNPDGPHLHFVPDETPEQRDRRRSRLIAETAAATTMSVAEVSALFSRMNDDAGRPFCPRCNGTGKSPFSVHREKWCNQCQGNGRNTTATP